MADDTCYLCHGKKGSNVPFVEKELLKKSVHGQNRCTACHRDAGSIPHPKKLAPVACGRCHSIQSRVYLNSRHGRAVKQDRPDAAVCSDCHGSGHEILDSVHENSPIFRRNIVGTCARCHSDTERMVTVRLVESDPVGSYEQTVHGKAFQEGNINSAVCTDCHSTHRLYNSLNPESAIFDRNIPDTCGACHREVADIYKESVHGRAALERAQESPVCTDCHGGGHSMNSPGESGSPTEVEAITQTCAGCHESELIIRKFDLPVDRLKTYRTSYHGLAARRGDRNVANCASCHGYHDILPSENPRSLVNKANLADTCGRCHPGAGEKLASGNIHGSPESKHWSLAFVRWFYLIVIPLALAVMLFHNGLDWSRKVLTGLRTASTSDALRLNVNERLQHFVLFSAFTLLALSGFALRFPDAAWAHYLAPTDEVMRRSLHRWAALVFTLLALYHFGYMRFSNRGKFLLREMKPRWDDVKDILAVFAYNLGIRRSPPVHSDFYWYSEKIEYWSLAFGSIVMIFTGALLVFNDFTLRHFPLWVADLATMVHFYEAILACLSIVIWHLYTVIFDPDVYPMNCAWLTGRIRCPAGKQKPGEKEFLKRIPYGRY